MSLLCTVLFAAYFSENSATSRLISTAGKPTSGTRTSEKSTAGSTPPTSSTLSVQYPGYIRLAQADTGGAATRSPQNDEVAEVGVTGTRQALVNAMTIKRDSLGIVDAISPQDIGKLPATNLAESLQRITGVSIDRSGGEGEFVTVRGFGPEFNTVLLNGRLVAPPAAPAQASGRAFSFDTLASELVSGVAVLKSSTAHLQSGGVGEAIN